MPDNKEMRDFEKFLRNALGNCVLVSAYVALAALAVVTRGFCLQQLWSWFLTPAIAIAAPSVALCMGLVLTLHYLFRPRRAPDEHMLTLLGRAAVEFCLVLLLGYLVHLLAEAYWFTALVG